MLAIPAQTTVPTWHAHPSSIETINDRADEGRRSDQPVAYSTPFASNFKRISHELISNCHIRYYVCIGLLTVTGDNYYQGNLRRPCSPFVWDESLPMINAVINASLIESLVVTLNPLQWSTLGYVITIALLLIIRQLIPRGGSWYIRLTREMLLIAPAVFIYFAVRGVMITREEDAFRNAETIVTLQTRLGIFHEPALQAWILGSNFLVNVVNWIYIWGHWPVVVGTLIWLIIFRPKTFSVYRNAFLISGFIAMFIFATYPVAPPRLMPELDVVDTVTEQSNSYRVFQPPALTNPYAAMPSLHFGWNLLMGIAIVREARLRPFKIFGYIMPVMMFLGIVLTANHYLLDGIAGGLLVGGSLWASVALLRSRGFDVWRGDDDGDQEEYGHQQVSSATASAGHPLSELPRPVTISHRAGNDIRTARRAAESGVDIVEADIWRYQGRLEVRHSKTVGRLPLRWDRWWIRFYPPPALELADLLRELETETTVMLDLKGNDPSLPRELLEICRRERPGMPILACSQTWSYLEQLRHEPDVSVIYSIGNRRQLARAWKMLEQEGYDAVSIHNEILTPETTSQLLDRVQAIITWPINDHYRLDRVSRLGVTGVISDSLDLLREIEQEKNKSHQEDVVVATAMHSAT
jgi:glycerophosphoryl diester phosphodiesterase